MAAAVLATWKSKRHLGEDTLPPNAYFVTTRGDLLISVIEDGALRALNEVVIRNQLEGMSRIIGLAPEGAHVKKGELLVELDSSDIKDRINAQEVAFQDNMFNYLQAQESLKIQKSVIESNIKEAELQVEFAKSDLEKYKEGDAPQAIKNAEGKIRILGDQVRTAQERLVRTEELQKKGNATKSEFEADSLSLKRLKLQMEQSQESLRLLIKFDQPNAIRMLESKVEQAIAELERLKQRSAAEIAQVEADLKTSKSALDVMETYLNQQKKQLANTKIYAPQDGLVVYSSVSPFFGRGEGRPEDGGGRGRMRGGVPSPSFSFEGGRGGGRRNRGMRSGDGSFGSSSESSSYGSGGGSGGQRSSSSSSGPTQSTGASSLPGSSLSSSASGQIASSGSSMSSSPGSSPSFGSSGPAMSGGGGSGLAMSSGGSRASSGAGRSRSSSGSGRSGSFSSGGQSFSMSSGTQGSSGVGAGQSSSPGSVGSGGFSSSISGSGSQGSSFGSSGQGSSVGLSSGLDPSSSSSRSSSSYSSSSSGEQGFYMGGGPTVLEEGLIVRQRQELIKLPDISRMLAEVKVQEARVRQIHPGMIAYIKVETLPDRRFKGTVRKVGILPDAQSSWANPDVKLYLTEVLIEDDLPELKPGVSARAQIIITNLPNVISVPIQSVVMHNGERVCFVLKGKAATPVPVTIGWFNDQFIEVKTGLKVGDKVLLAPPVETEAIEEGSSTTETNEPSLNPNEGGQRGPANRGDEPQSDNSDRPQRRPGAPSALQNQDDGPPSQQSIDNPPDAERGRGRRGRNLNDPEAQRRREEFMKLSPEEREARMKEMREGRGQGQGRPRQNPGQPSVPNPPTGPGQP